MALQEIDVNALLFDELRMIAVKADKQVTDEAIVKAFTLNENLRSLGYCFTPNSLPLLVQSNIDTLFETIKGYVGEVNAEPMYKGFPNEVMEMDEAVFRFHQVLHYLSTYGREFFTGAPVSKGWLPESVDIDRNDFDTFTTDLKQIEVVLEDEKYALCAGRLLSRKNRLTEKQQQLIKIALPKLEISAIRSLKIPFKENIQMVFELGIEKKSLPILKLACVNPMDAFKCINELLKNNKQHLRTSQKRMIAKLLDSYPLQKLESNMMYSKKQRESVIYILDHIDYSTYSRDVAKKEAVNALKNKKLHSWMSNVEKLIRENNKEELSTVLKERPGMLLRMGIRLIRLGYQSEVTNTMVSCAQKLSTQTIIDTLNYYYLSPTVSPTSYMDSSCLYTSDCLEDRAIEWTIFSTILKKALEAKLSSIETELKDKKVYIDHQDYDSDHSMILKSDEGGYNRGGLAFKIPENINTIRLFVYWNDKRCVDLDLHAYFTDIFNKIHHVGWDGKYNDFGVVFSGDITHSNAAEYIDIQLKNSKVDSVVASIDIYDGAYSFKEVDTCFTGIMGVSDLDQKIKLYDPKACFVSNKLGSTDKSIKYGLINVKDKYIRYMGNSSAKNWIDDPKVFFSLAEYLDILFKAQNTTIVDSEDEADLSIALAKGKDISIIDKNFWIDLD